MRTLAILGATGSIGAQTLDIVRKYPDRFRVDALTANENAEALFALVREFRPRFAALKREPKGIPEDVRFCEWAFGPDAFCQAAALNGVQDVLSAVVGIAGLPAALKALEHAERLLLANKEALVTGGELVTALAKRMNKPIVPVDSEHSAIYQCLMAANGNRPERLILTASGGPLRTWNKRDVENAKIEDALGHPTWRMGAKITVDSASLMNKGLEVIEAHHLFAMPLDQIDVVVHPESVVHSMVEFRDGAILAQMGAPDMRGPIGYAMGYPERLEYGGARLDFAKLGKLTFEAPDGEKFPCLNLAYRAQRAGGSLPVTLNAANEVAVDAFLKGMIPFGGIARLNDMVLTATEREPVGTYEDVYEADRRARALAGHMLQKAR